MDRGIVNNCGAADGRCIDGSYGSISPMPPVWCPAALAQNAPAPQPADDLRAAAAGALASLDGFMSGAPINPESKAQSDALARAASFASEAYRQGYDHDQATHAMLRAFLMALVDPLHTDLDYLRADPAAGSAARAALSQNGGAA